MMAALWSDVDADLASARHHLEQAIIIAKRCGFGDRQLGEYVLLAGFLHAMQSGYTSFESALKRIFTMLDEPLPGNDWHALILRRASRPLAGQRPAILDQALVDAADELRRFRHVAMQVYDRFDADRASSAVRAAASFLAQIDPAVARFRAAIDPG